MRNNDDDDEQRVSINDDLMFLLSAVTIVIVSGSWAQRFHCLLRRIRCRLLSTWNCVSMLINMFAGRTERVAIRSTTSTSSTLETSRSLLLSSAFYFLTWLSFIFSHSGYFCSASSSPLWLRSTPDTARILCQCFTPKRHRQLRVKDLSKVSTWRLERDSTPQPFRRKVLNVPMCHHAPHVPVNLYSFTWVCYLNC